MAAAHELGNPVRAHIEPGWAIGGQTRFEGEISEPDYAMFRLAGPAATRVLYGGLETGAEGDYDEVRQVCEPLGGDEAITVAHERAMGLVMDRQGWIMRRADELYCDGASEA